MICRATDNSRIIFGCCLTKYSIYLLAIWGFFSLSTKLFLSNPNDPEHFSWASPSGAHHLSCVSTSSNGKSLIIYRSGIHIFSGYDLWVKSGSIYGLAWLTDHSGILLVSKDFKFDEENTLKQRGSKLTCSDDNGEFTLTLEPINPPR